MGLFSTIKIKFFKLYKRYITNINIGLLSDAENNANFIEHEGVYKFEFNETYLKRLDPEIANGIVYHITKNYVQAGYLYHYKKPVYFDWKTFWAITKSNKLIPASILHYKERDYPFPRIARWGKKKVLQASLPVASINYGAGNYWHFFSNALGQVHYLNKHNLLDKVQVLIPENLYNIGFFQQALQLSPFLKNIHWLSQPDDMFVHAPSAWFCSNVELKKDHIIDICKWFNIKPGKGNRRIFLNRSKVKARKIANLQEILPVLHNLNFDMVDTGEIPLASQVKLFNDAEYVVGVHGAGLFNIVFRGDAHLGLLEIFPRHDIRGHYFAVAQNFGYTYDAICGSDEVNGEFTIDKETFAQHLHNLVSTL